MTAAVLTVSSAAVCSAGDGSGTADGRKYEIVVSWVVTANEKISSMVENELEKKNPDIEKLIEHTDKIAENVKERAEKFGIEIVCVYTEYEYEGQIFYIDPLIVIRR